MLRARRKIERNAITVSIKIVTSFFFEMHVIAIYDNIRGINRLYQKKETLPVAVNCV